MISSSSGVFNTPLIPSSNYSNDSSIRANIQILVDTALACPRLKELAQKSCEGDSLYGKKGPLEVIYDPENCKKMRTKGFTDHTNRKIVLSTLDCITALDILIFEVGNASQTNQYRTLQEQIRKRTITCDEYVKGVERIENITSVLHHQIVQWGINNLRWSPDLDLFQDITEENFERTWHQRIRFSEHAQFYRGQYALITKTDETRPGCKEKIDSKLRLLMYLIIDVCHGMSGCFKRMIKLTTIKLVRLS